MNGLKKPHDSQRRMLMSKAQKPICRVGTEFPAGTVVAIKNNGVLIDTAEGVKEFSLQQVERFVNDARSLSQA